MLLAATTITYTTTTTTTFTTTTAKTTTTTTTITTTTTTKAAAAAATTTTTTTTTFRYHGLTGLLSSTTARQIRVPLPGSQISPKKTRHRNAEAGFYRPISPATASKHREK